MAFKRRKTRANSIEKRKTMAGSIEKRTTMADSNEGREENHEDGDDLISELPTHLLCSIISFLPTKEAVATSLVCRRWRYLWLYLRRLDFDAWFMTDPCSNLYVEKVLRSQRNSFISSCRIVLTGSRRSLDEEKSWIQFLKTQKRLEKLEIIFEGKEIHPVWPPGFFNGRNLRVLELGHELTVIRDASPFEGCVNLETLNLNSVKLSDQTLKNIIENCTVLENLALIRCKGLSYVRIRDQRLKHLHIDDLHLKSFKLRSESLRVLSLSNFWCSSNDIDCPNLNVLRTDHNSSEILSRFSGLLGCEDRIGMELCTVRTLHSTLDLDDWYDLIVLRFIFRAWYNLQQLYITNEFHHEYQHHSLPYPQVLFWAGESTDSILYHLRDVQIRGFRGREKEMSFVSHLINNAEGLEKLVIQFDNACQKHVEDAKKELLSLSRASTNASIIFSVLNQKKRK